MDNLRVRPETLATVRIDGTVLRLSTDELVRLATRLRPYLTTPQPAWPAIVDAADRLRGELGVSKSLWGEACLAMGREEQQSRWRLSQPSRPAMSRPRRVGISTGW